MITTVQNIKIRGIANCVPETIVRNNDYDLLNDQEKKLLIKTTGIEERRVAKEGICASDLCYSAAEKLISELDWQRESIDAIIYVSQSQDYYLPSTAIILQERLKLSKRVLAFDVTLGCSGYVYGLQILGALMQTGSIKRGLLLAGDVSTNSVNYKDKSAYPIFGDSGSATALEYQEGATPMYFTAQSDGNGAEAIIIKGGGTRQQYHEDSLKEVEIEPGITRHELNLILNGLEIFNFSVKEVPADVKNLLEHVGVDKDEIDYYVFHQANRIINETIRKKLKINEDKVPYSLQKFGNTSSGSIPLTIQTALRDKVTSSKKFLLSGFGVGLSWSSAIIETDSLVIPELIEL